uniref:Platelet derived growth factor subunit B n=1 Tax=Eptatretus burgeri TaxID=7764 RepID=A0A8C4R211_EPTBU
DWQGGWERLSVPRSILEVISRSDARTVSDLPFVLPFDSVEYYTAEGIVRPRSLTYVSSQNRPEEAILAECRPRNTTVKLHRSLLDASSANFVLWPGCVELSRCTGCCNSAMLRCEATQTQLRTLKVAKIEYTRKKRLRMRETVVQVEEHLACQCQCRTDATCASHQVFNAAQCRCISRRRGKRRRPRCTDETCMSGKQRNQ